ncbi:MAG: hypothetical protein ACLFUB_04690 [Cyclobacteriaceae bacterium]
MSTMSTFYYQQGLHTGEKQSDIERDIFDLLNLLNHSYHALGLGDLNDIHELKHALEDVEYVKKRYVEEHYPADTESLGLASTMTNSEELETFERMVSFFHKRTPASGIDWEMFTIKKGILYFRNLAAERSELQARKLETLNRLIAALEEAEALGLNVFPAFDSPLIARNGKKYKIKKESL